MEEEKSLKKIKQHKKISQVIAKFKKTWLVSTLNTLLLIAILIVIFVLINMGVKKWNPTPIDCTTSKDYSLTDESKNRVKNIQQDVNIYFMNWDKIINSEITYYYGKLPEQYELAEQYNKANSKIKVQKVDSSKNIELAKKYNIESEDYKVIVESGKNSRILDAEDLVDAMTGNYIAEQKITSAILNITSGKIAKVYFLIGYTDFTIDKNLKSLEQYLKDEVLTYDTLNILNKKEVPTDCDTLIIMTPNKDFDDITRDAILKYIKKGGNILWFNGVYEEDKDFKNVNKVLAEFGVNKFEKGVVYETDASKVFGYVTCFSPTVGDSKVLEDIKDGMSVLFNATKININTEGLEKLKVEETELMTSSEKSYFTSNLTEKFNQKNDKKGSFVVGAQLTKTISEAQEASEGKEEKKAVKSELIIYGNDYFISDYPVQLSEGYQQTVFSILNNKDVVLNSIAYLTKNDQDITIRKSYTDSETSFTANEQEKIIIITIIFAVPVAIIIIGIIVWIIRKRRI